MKNLDAKKKGKKGDQEARRIGWRRRGRHTGHYLSVMVALLLLVSSRMLAPLHSLLKTPEPTIVSPHRGASTGVPKSASSIADLVYFRLQPPQLYPSQAYSDRTNRNAARSCSNHGSAGIPVAGSILDTWLNRIMIGAVALVLLSLHPRRKNAALRGADREPVVPSGYCGGCAAEAEAPTATASAGRTEKTPKERVKQTTGCHSVGWNCTCSICQE